MGPGHRAPMGGGGLAVRGPKYPGVPWRVLARGASGERGRGELGWVGVGAARVKATDGIASEIGFGVADAWRKGLCRWFGGNPRLLAGGVVDCALESSLQVVTGRLGQRRTTTPQHSPSTCLSIGRIAHEGLNTRNMRPCARKPSVSPLPRTHATPDKRLCRPDTTEPSNPETPSAQTGSLMQSISRSTSANVPSHASSRRGSLNPSPQFSVKGQSKPTGGN